MKKQKKPIVIVSIIVLLLLIVLGLFFSGNTGQAIFIGDEPYLGQVIDLPREQVITIGQVPTDPLTLSLLASPSIVRSDSEDYTLSFTPEDNYLVVELTWQGQLVGQDILYTRFPDETQFHLNTDDALPDIKLSQRNGEITIETLHFLPADSSIISIEKNDEVQGTILHVPAGGTLKLKMRAESSSLPSIETNIPGSRLLLEEENESDNFVIYDFEFVAPEDPQFMYMDVIATVSGRETIRTYTIAVGDAVYNNDPLNAPAIDIKQRDGRAGELNIRLDPTTELQPLALPCHVQNQEPLFNHPNVNAIYGYDTSAQQAQIFTPGEAADEITRMELFKGYYVELRDPQETIVTLACDVKSLLPVTSFTVPRLAGPSRHTLQPGWTLFSLPGTSPQSLQAFTQQQLQVHQCTQDYTCSQRSDDILNPGEAYWVYSDNHVNINYILE